MINKVTIIGNLGKDAEIVKLKNNSTVANLHLATTESRKNHETGKRKNHTEWHKVVAFGKNAHFSKTLKKGFLVYVDGRLQTRYWIDKQNNNRQTTEIYAKTLINMTHKTTQEMIQKNQNDTIEEKKKL